MLMKELSKCIELIWDCISSKIKWGYMNIIKGGEVIALIICVFAITSCGNTNLSNLNNEKIEYENTREWESYYKYFFENANYNVISKMANICSCYKMLLGNR